MRTSVLPRGTPSSTQRHQEAIGPEGWGTAGVNPACTSTSSTLCPDLEPLSFDDLPLGGEWTTRRRTVSEAEIALFAGLAGDFSPMTIEASRDGRREAPPAMVVAMAVGLGSIDMPVPAIADWEWLNWKFPRAVHAGDTIYAHWMLTQKRPSSSGASSSIVVWRVDIHTADGGLVAEGEVGAKVVRGQAPKRIPEPAAPAARGRRRRRPRGNGAAAAPEPPPIAAPPAAASKPERAAGPSRRRRRRRSPSSVARDENHEPRAAHVPETDPAPAPAATQQPAASGRKGIGGVLRRLRGS